MDFGSAPVPQAGCSLRIELDACAASSSTLLFERELERLITRACFHAASVATGCISGYKLECCYGPDGARDNKHWPRERRYVWDNMRDGSPAVRPALARQDKSVLSRFAAVRAKSDLLDRVLTWSLWRHLDRRDLHVKEIVQRPADTGAYAIPLLHGPMITHRLSREFVSRMRAGLRDAETRYCALNALWYYIRRAEADTDLPLYILSYLLWKESSSILAKDPVLGPISKNLYSLAASRFGHIDLNRVREPANTSDFNYLSMYGIKSTWDCSGQVLHIDANTLAIVDPVGPFKRRNVFS